MKGVAAIAALVAVLAIAGYMSSARKVKTLSTKQSVSEPLAFETTTVPNPQMWSNQQRVKQEGRDGVAVRETFYLERWVAGKRISRELDPTRKPRVTVLEEPVPQIVEVGTRDGTAFDLGAASETGSRIGTIGPSGVLAFDVEGSITFAGDDTVTGPDGNSSYDYSHDPLRTDVDPGATLVRVGDGPWLSLDELDRELGVYAVKGEPGQGVWAVVNDAPGYFEDNRGSFRFVISGESG